MLTAAGLVDRAVADGVIPGAVLAAGLASGGTAGEGTGAEGTAGPLLLHVAGDAQRDEAARRPMTADTAFDLASLTKVTATLPCLLYLASGGAIGLDDPVRRYLPSFTGQGKDQVTVRQLLTHTSGLPAERRYYRYLSDPAEVRAAALAEPLAAAPGSTFCYSDVGFIAAGELAAAVAGLGLGELAQQVVFGPLGMTSTRFLPPAAWASRIAATEPVTVTGPVAGTAPGGTGTAGTAPGGAGTAKVGVVHDENAEVLGGVAGHAGLFGTAADLARYASAWAGDPGAFWGLREEALRCQTEGLGGRRGLGWGLRGDRWDNMGDGWPPAGAGHTGFTGTSISVDPASGLWAVLLTNAVHFGRGPEHSVVGLRKQVHAAVAATLLPGAPRYPLRARGNPAGPGVALPEPPHSPSGTCM
jgi:CubicO group peptidase (beta-lactamase class C family)